MSGLDRNNQVSLEENVSVSITTQSINVQFKGPLQSVIKGTLDFFIKQFPEVDPSRKISLDYDTNFLVKRYAKLIKISSQEVQVLVKPETSSTDIMEKTSPNKLDHKDVKAPGDDSKTKLEAKWSVKEFIALELVASRIAKGLRIIQHEGMKISDIESATKANPKSVTSRLSEMIKSGYVTKDLRFSTETVAEGTEEPSTIYRITTVGIHWLNNIIDKKVKTENGE
jgi:hypothetical protein